MPYFSLKKTQECLVWKMVWVFLTVVKWGLTFLVLGKSSIGLLVRRENNRLIILLIGFTFNQLHVVMEKVGLLC